MKAVLFLALALVLPSAGYAQQTGGIGCPPIDGSGRRLTHGQAGTLYLGNPAKKGSQAPDSDDGRVSVYRLPQGGDGYFLACHYDGSATAAIYPVPAAAKSCRQDASSFVCR